MTKTEQTVLNLLANSLFSADRPIDESVDWSEVWKEAYAQAVPNIVFSGVNADSFSDNLKNEIRFKSKILLAKSMSMNAAHAELNRILGESNIPYVILKGFASARYYPDYALRAMGDVDFLISAQHLDKASDILISAGYEMSHENHDYHRVFQKGPVRLEMHFEPSGIPHGEAGAIIRKYLENTIECAERVDTDFGEMRVPFTFHHGLIILMHTAHHLTSGGVGLRHLCDWAVFVNSLTDKEFCELFEDKLKRAGLWHFACVLTRCAEIYLGCPEKSWSAEAEEELCENIICDIFSAGNFGQKDEKRYEESLMMSGGKTGGRKSVLVQFFSSLNRIVRQNWGITKKLKFLLPIGWIFFGGRYIIRMLMGKRPKIHLAEAKTEAEKRMEIYDKLKLYEKDKRRKQ